MDAETFGSFLWIMTLVAALVFIALYFVKAGYGMFRSAAWGLSVNNKLAWMLMEVPVFLVMIWMWWYSDRRFLPVQLTFFFFFQLHYFQRSFVFPCLLQGEWIFYLSPADRYTSQWFAAPQFILGTVLFFVGMGINCHSDYIIRHLRTPGDTRHYLPSGGLYRYVTSANYFGEIVEWTGWAILTWSLSGTVFLWWTFANLVPRANAIWHRYREEFGEAVGSRKRIFPFIY